MASYLVGQISVKNADLWQKYVAGVQESLAAFNCTIVFRGKLAAVLAGHQEYDLIVVIEFQDQSTLENWYASEKYQSLIPLRTRAAKVVISSYTA